MHRKIFIFVVLVICLGLGHAASFSLGTGQNEIRLVSSDDYQTVLDYRINSFDYEEVNIDGDLWHQISLPGEGHSQERGLPQLPVFNRSIIIDNRADVGLELLDVEFKDIHMPIAPSKGVITRDIDPRMIAYEFDPIYNEDIFYPKELASLSEAYILRDFRGVTVRTSPFAYNPHTETLRIYTKYRIRVFSNSSPGQNTLERRRAEISRAFLPIYENHFVNWPSYRYIPVGDSFGKLLVISYNGFMESIQDWVDWKRQKGIETSVVDWSSIGLTAANLKSYIQNAYNTDPELTFVQIIGDAPQVPTLIYQGGGSDPGFSLVAGSDYYPDIFVGRFSAETEQQLQVQLNRSMAYERDMDETDLWLSRATGIASAQGAGMGDMGESDIEHMNIIRDKLLDYHYSTVDQIYDPFAQAATVTTSVNAGRGFINYIGHGSNYDWTTTGFNFNHAMNLTNDNKAPFIVDVACVNGNFVSITCFAEAWMRSPQGGAISIYASSINQSWASPMRAQDEITDLWVGESKSSVGGFYYNGSCAMMDAYGNYNGADGMRMFMTWNIFGDASLVPRSRTPLAMSISHPHLIDNSTQSLTVSSSVADALVSLSYDGQIYASGYSDHQGLLSLDISALPQDERIYTLTATAHNRITYISEIEYGTHALPELVGPRFVAEWEPAQGAVVRYPFGQPNSLLEALAEDDLLFVIVTENYQAQAQTDLQAAGVNMENLRYIIAPTETYWVRDYGPWTIFDENLDMHLVDFNYNRPRPNDNAIPSVIASYLEEDLYDLDMNHTGGNIMTDGRGTAMSTDLVLTENSHLSLPEINQRFEDVLGISDYQIYTDPTGTYIDHIDCWAKLLDVDKVLIRRVPTGHSQYQAIETSVSQWQSKISPYGKPYRIYRVDTPNNEPYTNSFIMNGKIHIPLMGTANDAAALAIYEEAMPGFEILGYSYMSYQSTDALHCRVSTIFDNQMIAIRHTMPEDYLGADYYNLSFEIDHAHELDHSSSRLYWRASPDEYWQQSFLISAGGNAYYSSISVDQEQYSISYWISAEDSSGRSVTLPLSGALDPFDLPIRMKEPQLSISTTSSGLLLSWDEVEDADLYRIMSADSPDGVYSLLVQTSELSYAVEADASRKFFRVIAVKTDTAPNNH